MTTAMAGPPWIGCSRGSTAVTVPLTEAWTGALMKPAASPMSWPTFT